ncbi:type II toxin-antitoxin system PemK/MazF family toxin [Metabacillus fastidiosus]|uniref:type II toxin-antitoxin system PemK/MazF family toxin n=1 Tax=Metabacillus fastidiosus TaxID=1458 RepID=UPI000ADE5B9D|nr:type II toxin-antitoxin system PemK/MazF family toxin [Metabacillus fastidiosus]
MRYSDIKVGYVYFADLNPVRPYEFGDNHLSIVLNKGKDKRTVTIVSLTSKKSGVGENKLNIGVIPKLPKRLVQDKHGNSIPSYVVLDQVRTVAANRIQEVKDGKNPDGTDNFIECPIDPSLFGEIVHKLADLRISNLNDVDAIGEYHKSNFFHYCVNKLINLTYNVINERGNVAETKEEIRHFYTNVLAIKKDFSIDNYLNQQDIQHKVSEKLNDIVLVPVK